MATMSAINITKPNRLEIIFIPLKFITPEKIIFAAFSRKTFKKPRDFLGKSRG
jgi:hypothetical protein